MIAAHSQSLQAAPSCAGRQPQVLSTVVSCFACHTVCKQTSDKADVLTCEPTQARGAPTCRLRRSRRTQHRTTMQAGEGADLLQLVTEDLLQSLTYSV